MKGIFFNDFSCKPADSQLLNVKEEGSKIVCVCHMCLRESSTSVSV